MTPNLRLGIFVVLGAFFLLGPIETQVFLGPARSVKRPYLPMHWHMYHGVGVGFCQAQLYAERDGARVALTKDEVSKAVGRGSPRSRKRSERFNVGKKARANDLLLPNEGELADVARALCAAEPNQATADVRAQMRCSPPAPSGPWRTVEDGEANLCARRKWSPGVSSPEPPSVTVDPLTGEEPAEGSEPAEQ